MVLISLVELISMPGRSGRTGCSGKPKRMVGNDPERFGGMGEVWDECKAFKAWEAWETWKSLWSYGFCMNVFFKHFVFPFLFLCQLFFCLIVVIHYDLMLN